MEIMDLDKKKATIGEQSPAEAKRQLWQHFF